MKIKVNVSNFLNKENDLKRVNHIKAIREQIDYTLREAKDISDIVYNSVINGFTPDYFYIETNHYPQLDFMIRDDRIKNLVKKPNDVIVFLENTVFESEEVKLLKATANKLIKINAFESAKLILDILYDLEEASEDA